MSQPIDDDDATDGENENDGEETFGISAPEILDENDFYKLLDVNSNATQEEIRVAYKRRAREFHPDKNTVDTTRIFQAVKLAYSILDSEAQRIEYDEDIDIDDKDDDSNEILSRIKNSQMRSNMDENITNVYKEQIDHYLNEYENLSFSNNFNGKVQEIIGRVTSIDNHATVVDTYVQCTVCQQSCIDLHVHQRENCEPYEKMFNTAASSLSFEQIIGSEIWNWKAVERTSIHLPIWNTQEKWNQLSRFISELTEPVQIICNPERYWTSLIDTYEQNKVEIMKLPILLSQMSVVNFLPDLDEIQTLKAIFDKYDQTGQRNILSKLKNKDERIESGDYYLFDSTITNEYIDKNAFSFPITDPPSEIYREQCYECQKSFSFLTRHHHCRMCGQQFCADCLIYKRIPHLGFIIKPVRICRKCSDEKEHFICQHILIYVKHLIELDQLQYLSIYLALLHLYEATGNELFYRKTGEQYYQTEKYSLALQCFTYARVSSDVWLKYSDELCRKGEYSYSFTCMKLCEKVDDFWVQQARSQQNPIYALLCYERIKLSPEQLFEVACQKSSDNMNTCLLYLVYLSIKYANQVNWKIFGEQILLKTKYDGNLAMFCFHLYGKMQKDEWNSIAEQLCQSNAFDRLAYFLAYLYYVQQIDFRTSIDGHIYFMTKILLSSDTIISLDDWLDEIHNTAAYDVNRIIIELSIANLYKYTSWIEYKNQYIERKEYYKALLCHKMAEYLDENSETTWFINAIEDLDPIGYELFNQTNSPSDWKQLGDQYFQNENFSMALNCYLFCEQNQVDKILIQQAQTPMLSLSIELLYYTVVYKRTRIDHSKVLSKNNSVLCNETFYNICVALSKRKDPYVLELVTLAIQMYETENRWKNIELFKYHLFILNEINKTNDENGKNDRLINGGLHILLTFDNLSNESMNNLISLNQSLLDKTNEKVVNELKSDLFKPAPQFMATLLNPNNYFLASLKQLFQQCLGSMELALVKPVEYRAKLYLIEAMIFKLNNNPVRSICSAHGAITSEPDNLLMFSVVTFINHSHMHSTVRQSLISDIKKNSFDLADINPPTQIKNLHYLNRTEDLILLKKYERAIVKRLADGNPVQAAFSYVDLFATITGSAAQVCTSLTMACLYFYKAMTNLNCTAAELYAYRSIIFYISAEVFYFTQHNVSLYIQMYIYKLLYTIILRSSDLFTKRMEMSGGKSSSKDQLIINESHEEVLEKLLTNILQLSKVNPLTYAPSTSMVHDMIYMEYAGDKFLKKYLESKKTSSTVYQYYYFEGISKGWIDETNFVDERQICMQNLLDDINWTTDDVEDLLSWSLIPKTDDGWLLNTKHRLQFEQTAYSQVIGITLNNDTGEIEFMFTQAKKNEHNLFDAADVMDVLTNCIDSPLFRFRPPSDDYHLHPFYEMRYLPRRLSKTPNYLLTLLHVDYLLKMISTGVEISSIQPFEMRSTAENLMQCLPTHIREELQAIPVKTSGAITDIIHEFWIRPEPIIEYERAFYKNFFGRTNQSITQIYLTTDLKMYVRHHDVEFDEMGNLMDDENEINDDDQSPEAQFARTFTKYYDEIGQYFPELLRLKELLKLTILSRFIRLKYHEQCEVVSRIENDPELEQFFRGFKQKFGHYLTLSNKLSEDTLNTLSKRLCKEYMCKKSLLKPYLSNWLKYDQEQPLLQYLKQSLIQHRTKLKYTIEKLNLFDNNDDDSTNEMRCSWVPAALSIDSNMMIYGGIALAARVKHASGLKEVQEKSKSIIRIDANKLFLSVEKQKSKQKRDNNKTRKRKPRKDGSGGGIGRKPPLNEIKTGSITYSKIRSEARRNALESSGISTDVKLLWIEEIDTANVDMEQKLRNDAIPGDHQLNIIKPKTVLEVYQHSDGYLVCLQANIVRSYNETRPQMNADTSGTKKTYYNVFYEKDSGHEETNQQHYFDRDD